MSHRTQRHNTSIIRADTVRYNRAWMEARWTPGWIAGRDGRTWWWRQFANMQRERGPYKYRTKYRKKSSTKSLTTPVKSRSLTLIFFFEPSPDLDYHLIKSRNVPAQSPNQLCDPRHSRAAPSISPPAEVAAAIGTGRAARLRKRSDNQLRPTLASA